LVSGYAHVFVQHFYVACAQKRRSLVVVSCEAQVPTRRRRWWKTSFRFWFWARFAEKNLSHKSHSSKISGTEISHWNFTGGAKYDLCAFCLTISHWIFWLN